MHGTSNRAEIVREARNRLRTELITGGYIELYGRPFCQEIEGRIFGYADEVAEHGVWRRRRFLLIGETGTGKERLARIIGQACIRLGPAPKQEVHTINISAINPNLLATELFGHVAGAFTGAPKSRTGAIRTAGFFGALFLDEIGDAPPEVQSALLRFLENDEVHPVGSDVVHVCPVHVIAATSRSMGELTSGRSFKRDLYHRLSADVIEIPPLRALLAERSGGEKSATDIWRHIIARALRDSAPDYDERWSGVAAQPRRADVEHPRQAEYRNALELIHADQLAVRLQAATKGYEWPGNLREAVSYAGRELARASLEQPPQRLESSVRLGESTDEPFAEGNLPERLRMFERAAYVQALSRSSGNVRAAAAALGVDYQVALRRIDNLGIKRRSRAATPRGRRAQIEDASQATDGIFRP